MAVAATFLPRRLGTAKGMRAATRRMRASDSPSFRATKDVEGNGVEMIAFAIL